MVKLIRLCFACCLVFVATLRADIQNYQAYIIALKELEEQYSDVDKTIDLSDCTMREVVKQLHDVLQLRAHGKISASQEDSHPALLKVNKTVYELYFHGTKNMPGNCVLKRQGCQAKTWMKGGEYNLELNTKENYVEQNLLFCLEIARRSVKGGPIIIEVPKIDLEEFCFQKSSEPQMVPVYPKDQFKGLDIVGCIALASSSGRLPDANLFECFKGEKRNDFLKKYLSTKPKNFGKLKKTFLDKKITDRIFPVTERSDFFKESAILEKVRMKSFTHWEPIRNLAPKGLNIASSKGITPEEVIKAIRSIDFSQLEFKSSNKNDGDSIYKGTLKVISDSLHYLPVYVLDGDATKNFIKFLEGDQVKKYFKIEDRYFVNGLVFLHATGKDGITRWFYLNKSNGTMYLLNEVSE